MRLAEATPMTHAVSCPHCGASHRVGVRRRGGQPPLCGRCGAPLQAASLLVETTDARFEEQVLASPLPVLLHVWAPWCVPCRGMEPVIDELASSLQGRVRVARLNLDRNPDTVARLRIQGVPTLIVFRGGHEARRLVGARDKAALLLALSEVA
jgi:thioredoxin 2